jgi:hypothetical protein
MAKLMGIGPLWSFIPCLMAANAALVVTWHLVAPRGDKKIIWRYPAALVLAAGLKAFILFVTISKILIPFVLNLSEKQAATLSAMFSVNQLITASLGGMLAIAVVPTLKKALGMRRKMEDQ